MKLLAALILSLLSASAIADVEVAVSAGQSFVFKKGVADDEHKESVIVTAQTASDVFVGMKSLSYVGSDFYSAYAGFQFGDKLKAFSSLGVGYLTNPDGYWNGEWNGKLTGHLQFNVTAGVKYYVDPDVFVTFAVDHISNCTRICKRSSENLPNFGRNYLSIGLGYKF